MLNWLKRIGKWKCLKCGEYYKPSRGERMRLEYWGCSGVADNHKYECRSENE